MSPNRRRLVYSILAIVLLGHGVAFWLNADLWPFSPYQMYAVRQSAYTLDQYNLFGVAASTPERELLLWDDAYFHPLGHYRVRSSLVQFDVRKQTDELTEAMRETLRRYEALRSQGKHDGPQLQALRLYRVTWQLAADASMPADPTNRALVLEVRPDEAHR